MGERKRRVYDQEFKKEAVRLFLKKEKSASGKFRGHLTDFLRKRFEFV